MTEHKQPVSEAQGTEAIINKGRRRLSKVALATPVIASLASRPALAGNCLSNMLSGNLSDPNRGQCSKGWSPGGWGQPGGTISIYSTLGAWNTVGLIYGQYDESLANSCNVNRSACYQAGTTIAALAWLNKDSVPATTPLREILNAPQNQWQYTRGMVCAYLNASLSDYFRSMNSNTFWYVLTVDQLSKLESGALPVPGNMFLADFLYTTW